MQDLLESKLDKLRKNLLGAPPGRHNVIFVDDINMPALEKYGAQPPIELVRQALAQGGFYDLKKLFFKRVQNTSFIAACGPPGGGRNAITQRLVRHFNLLWLPTIANESMKRIFVSVLDGFLSVSGFQTSVIQLAEPVVRGTIEIYTKMCVEMLPTPSKSHYTFNLRDVSRVMQGILQITPSNIPDDDAFLRLWAHETSRVFCDRLVSASDRSWFLDRIVEVVGSPLFSKQWEPEPLATLVYGSFMNTANGVAGMVYQEVAIEAAAPKFDEYLADYNLASTKPMNLVFFTDCCLHLARLSRIITQPRGCALLVGVGGSGRSSLVRLAASLWDMKCLGIEITRTYDMVAWHEDVKTFMFAAGCENKPTVFLFSDTQIIKEAMLEDVNNILNSGEVPNLFETEDMEKILGAVRPLAKEAGMGEGRDQIYAYFVQLVRENLHIVLCMSPIGDAFRVRCRMFPSLINCCTIDWFDEWPKDALLSVAQRYFEKLDVSTVRSTPLPAVHVHHMSRASVQLPRAPDVSTGDSACKHACPILQPVIVISAYHPQPSTRTAPALLIALCNAFASLRRKQQSARFVLRCTTRSPWLAMPFSRRCVVRPTRRQPRTSSCSTSIRPCSANSARRCSCRLIGTQAVSPSLSRPTPLLHSFRRS